MPRGKKPQPEQLTPLVCFYCGARPSEQCAIRADREGFDWYSGEAVGRLACCRACRIKHRAGWVRFINSYGAELPGD